MRFRFMKASFQALLVIIDALLIDFVYNGNKNIILAGKFNKTFFSSAKRVAEVFQ